MTGGLPCLGLRRPWLSGGIFRSSIEGVIYAFGNFFVMDYAPRSS